MLICVKYYNRYTVFKIELHILNIWVNQSLLESSRLSILLKLSQY